MHPAISPALGLIALSRLMTQDPDAEAVSVQPWI